MRYLAFIFSIYSLLLAVVPNTDEYNSINLKAASEFTESTDDENKINIHLCSPFCTCCQNFCEVSSFDFNFITQPLALKQKTLTSKLLNPSLQKWLNPPIV